MTITYIRPLAFAPGIDRDGTNFSRVAYSDGEWVRFYRDRPRKIGGYQLILNGNKKIIRTLATCSSREADLSGAHGIVRMFAGQEDAIVISDINYGSAFSSYDVTPETSQQIELPTEGTAGYFLPNPKNLWNFDFMTINAASPDKPTDMRLEHIAFAFVGQNALDIGSTYQPTIPDPLNPPKSNNACVFFQIQNGPSDSKFTKFVPLYVDTPQKVDPTKETGFPPPPPIAIPGVSKTWAMPSISGGLCVAGSFLFLYGSDGLVMWSSPGNPFVFPQNQQASISSSKIVKGIATRGGGTTSVLFWSLTDVILAQFSPTSIPVPPAEGSSGPTVDVYTYSFSFDTLRTDVSIISANSVVEYNGNFYWVGLNQFYVYNGTVQSLPNSMNKKYFFDGINPKATSKIWGISNPQYDEITWFYPRGESMECSHSITYNVPGNFWYDTEISRSAGFSCSLFLFPIMADSGVNARTEYPQYGIWRHETGSNAVYSTQNIGVFPIKSSFTTPPIMLGKENPENDVLLMTRRFEPDFRDTGDYSYEKQDRIEEADALLNPMELQIITKNFAQSKAVVAKKIPFDKKTQYVNINGAQGRQVQYKFISDTKDGSYQMGDVIITFSAGDVRSG